MSRRNLPYVSVVIPVFNHSERLDLCLAALAAQTYPGERFEVIVVDNGSPRSLESRVEGYPRSRVVHEPKPGSYAARNRGISVARGEVLAFTDADCVPSPEWIERGVERILGLPSPGMLAGRIDCVIERPDRPTAAELYESVAAFRQRSFLDRSGFAATANMFTSKRALDVVGPFDETLKSGGDLDWGQRARASGCAQVYADDVVVEHPARRSLRQLFEKNARIAGGLQDIDHKRGAPAVAFVKGVLKDLLPLRLILSHLSDRRLRGIGRKLKFAAVAGWLGFARARERLRVRFGGVSRRT